MSQRGILFGDMARQEDWSRDTYDFWHSRRHEGEYWQSLGRYYGREVARGLGPSSSVSHSSLTPWVVLNVCEPLEVIVIDNDFRAARFKF